MQICKKKKKEEEEAKINQIIAKADKRQESTKMETDEQRNLNLWYFHQALVVEEDVNN